MELYKAKSKKAFHKKYIFEGTNGNIYCDKKSPIAEFLFRFNAYNKILYYFLKARIPITDLFRARYPFYLTEPKKPTMLSLELTNNCNLRCSYCPTSADVRKKNYMSEVIFFKVIKNIIDYKINRVHIRGWGEPTLHPKFGEFSKELSRITKLVDIVTNAQWKDEQIIRDLLLAPVNRIDISLDVGGRGNYEITRKGASYERLLKNIKQLHFMRNKLKSKSKIIIRIMFRPSQATSLKKETSFWLQYADAVIPAPLFQITYANNKIIKDNNLFVLTASQDKFPRCYFPFNELVVSYNGDIPLCDNLVLTKDQRQVTVGNILNNSLNEIWHGKPMTQLRKAHKKYLDSQKPLCKNCTTC